jgi:hypothetical protein
MDASFGRYPNCAEPAFLFTPDEGYIKNRNESPKHALTLVNFQSISL